MHIYESCTGQIYVTEEEKDFDDLYCETCGDCDMYIGYADTKEEAIKLLKEESYNDEFIQEFIVEHYGRGE